MAAVPSSFGSASEGDRGKRGEGEGEGEGERELYTLFFLYILLCRSVSPNHFQTSNGTDGPLTECKATEQRAQKGVELRGLLRKEEPQHLRGRDAASLSLAGRLGHPPVLPELPR